MYACRHTDASEMAERIRATVRLITSELDKSKISALNKTIAVIDNAGGKIRKTLNETQSTLSSRQKVLTKLISGDTTIYQNLKTKWVRNADHNSTSVASVIRLWQWYQRLIGMERLEVCKKGVDFAQDKLFSCQDERRNLSREATAQNEKLKEVYAELLQTKRDDPRYVQLTILENKTLQDLGKIVTKLDLLEKDERDQFTLLATAIKEYHVTQDICAQRYKYISIITSAFLAIVSLIVSMIYNNKRIESGKTMLSNTLDQNKLALANTVESISGVVCLVLNKLDEMKEKADIPIDNNVSPEKASFPVLGISKTCVALGVGILGILFLKALCG